LQTRPTATQLPIISQYWSYPEKPDNVAPQSINPLGKLFTDKPFISYPELQYVETQDFPSFCHYPSLSHVYLKKLSPHTTNPTGAGSIGIPFDYIPPEQA